MSEQLLQQILDEMKEMKIDLNGVKDEMKELKVDLNGVKADMKEMKVDLNGVKSDMKEMKVDLNGVKADMKEMRSDLDEVKSEQYRQGDLLHQLVKTVGATNAKVDVLEPKFHKSAETIEAIETDIRILMDESLNQKREIYRLKRVSD
ncbi:hypothetical protein MUB24_05150 [Lederbergia sp. NSJ-179]|uniref:hypothetical protein n=1 Tax=Lederbergia sp. NSJ-179 TaxID=2931402 RepID=UPI001FD2BAB2|nr:hypothetical protein [Lederbergia sp. NSJ-179]MCJ7840311.1 hypothetical protein [Lederbergia sp. NSJ-179]